MRTDPILVTGAAGFIGFHTTQKLLARGEHVVGVDNLNDYYDVRLKEARLEILQGASRGPANAPFACHPEPAKSREGGTEHGEGSRPSGANGASAAPHSSAPPFTFHRLDVYDRDGMKTLFEKYAFKRVIHLAAQAGVRYSLQNPQAYVDSNLQGFLNILEGCRGTNAEHLVYASSSSVYGANGKLPFSEHDNIDHPMSLYAASKKANELMAHSYSSLYQFPTTGLRFFTVYGPWGRPDMALFLFTKAMLAGEPIKLFNNGEMIRDFTYVGDIVEGIVRVLDNPAAPDPSWSAATPDPARSYAPYRVFNIGNNSPVHLLDCIAALEKALGIEAKREYLPMQAGDVPATQADVSELEKAVGFRPETTIKEGIDSFVEWYRAFYQI